MKITFLLGFYPNQRMNKRMRLLMKNNDVSLIYWKKSDDDSGYGTDIATDNYTCVDVQFNESSLKDRFFAFRKFKKEALRRLEFLQPDCIYVQNLDLFMFAESYKRLKKNRIKLVYEVSDINDILIQPQKNALKKLVQAYLRVKEKIACRNVDFFCYTSPAFTAERYGMLVPYEKSMYLPNIPNMSYFNNYSYDASKPFTIGYVGTVRYEKQLRLMQDAAKEAGVKALIAGGIVSGGSRGNKVDIESMKKDYPDTEFIGTFDYPSEIANIYRKIDVSFAVYDNHLQNVKVALPNKLYEAIRCRIPLVVAPDTYLAETVVRLGVGTAVSDKDELVALLKKLKTDKAYYSEFQTACEQNADFIDADKINRDFCAWFNPQER